jgi:hypothetical protein
MRTEYAADYLLTAYPERFARREHEQEPDHIQRLAQDGWLLDATDAELAALTGTKPDTVRRERNRMARDYGLASILRRARDVGHAIGSEKTPGQVIADALDFLEASNDSGRAAVPTNGSGAPRARGGASREAGVARRRGAKGVPESRASEAASRSHRHAGVT